MQSHLLQAQLNLMQHEEVKGMDARCVSNLVWAIVKLEVAAESGQLGYELVQTASPLVVRFLPQSSCQVCVCVLLAVAGCLDCRHPYVLQLSLPRCFNPASTHRTQYTFLSGLHPPTSPTPSRTQGIANLLWSYAKMSVPPLDVMMAIVVRMTEMLHSPATALQFDAQALSNSVWALAHIKSKVVDLDLVAGKQGCVKVFMHGVANVANLLLRSLNSRMDLGNLQGCMLDAEKRFSCQVGGLVGVGVLTVLAGRVLNTA